MDSILTSIKKMLGIEADYTHFDPDIIVAINSAFMFLYQLGVGPVTCFSITDAAPIWTDFLGTNIDLESVKTYTYFKTRLMFDPPTSSFVLEAMERQVKELEWRLYVQVYKPPVDITTEEVV